VAQPSEGQERLERIERGVLALRGLVAEVASMSEVDVTDPSGQVRVVLAPDGLPERIELGDDWRRVVGAEGFAEAVTRACRSGAEDRSGTLEAAMTGSGWVDRAAAVMAYIGGEGPEPPDLPRRSQAATVGAPRQLAEVLVDLMAEPGKYTGVGGHGRLSLTLELTGAVTCAADPEWVGRQETDELRDALTSALASLHAACRSR
jgi:hypothetical protein